MKFIFFSFRLSSLFSVPFRGNQVQCHLPQTQTKIGEAVARHGREARGVREKKTRVSVRPSSFYFIIQNILIL